MAKAETNISNAIRMVLSAIGARVFRNHRGTHYTMDKKRIVTTGLAPGASDLIGWTPVTVTPAMVGKTVAIFTSVEVKSGDNGTTTEQDDWLNAVRSYGGIAIVARSKEEARDKLYEAIACFIRLAIRV